MMSLNDVNIYTYQQIISADPIHRVPNGTHYLSFQMPFFFFWMNDTTKWLNWKFGYHSKNLPLIYLLCLFSCQLSSFCFNNIPPWHPVLWFCHRLGFRHPHRTAHGLWGRGTWGLVWAHLWLTWWPLVNSVFPLTLFSQCGCSMNHDSWDGGKVRWEFAGQV